MFHEYPYTTYYHDIDKMCKCCKVLKYRLDTHGDYLRLVDEKGEVASSVKVTYADTALKDVDGNPIKSYIISAGTNGTHLVFTKGNDEIISFEVPYSITAAKDVQNKNLIDYVYGVSTSGDKLTITKGDGTTIEITVPYAVKASTTVDGYDLTMTAISIDADGREIVLRDTKGRELSRITPNFAVVAQKDVDNDDIKSTYANSLSQGTTTVKLLAKDGTVLSEQTVNYATSSLKDVEGNLFLSDYAEKIVVDGDNRRIGIEAHDGTRLATITVPFATLATDATNAVERVEVIGDNIIFTTYAGNQFSVVAPKAIKADKDGNGNTIINTYFANASSDPDEGTITFYDAVGQVVAEIHNGTITRAIYDDHDNKIADYVKSVTADNQSDYLTVTHGDGDVDSVKVNYSEHAYMDTNNNVIKNTYVKRLECVEDVEDGHYKLVAYNGDNPEAELFRIEIIAYKAQCDITGREITSYIGNVEADGDHIDIVDGTDTVVNRVSGKAVLTPEGTVSTDITKDMELVTADVTPNTPSSFTYNAETKTLKITSGTALSTTDVQVVKEVSASSKFTGTESEAVVRFENEEV